VFGGITLLFFMMLVTFSLFGYTIPENSRYLVAFVFGLSGGLSFAFISGTAMASGAIPIPGTLAKISFSAGGGVAATLLFALIGYWIIPGESLPVVVGIDGVRVYPSKDPKTATVQADYHLQGRDDTHSVFLETSWTKEFQQPTRKRLDAPDEKQTTFDLELDDKKEGSPFWVRIVVENRQGRKVAESKKWEAKTPKKD
jgi:hypothetical protein